MSKGRNVMMPTVITVVFPEDGQVFQNGGGQIECWMEPGPSICDGVDSELCEGIILNSPHGNAGADATLRSLGPQRKRPRTSRFEWDFVGKST